jgi:Uma2 family endonuclease
MTASMLVAPNIEKKVRRYRKPIIPLTLDEREDMRVRELRIPATIDEYFALVQDVDYIIHYSRGHIVSFIEFDEPVDKQNKRLSMGQAAPLHERLTALLIYLISDILGFPKSEYQGYGSNIKLYISGTVGAYNPDIAFTKGEGIIEKVVPAGRKRSTKVLTNPHILVEVLSDGTRDFDFNEKWKSYQKIDSLRQMIFVEQEEVNIKTYIKQGANRWLYIELNDINDQLPIFEKEATIALNDIYQANMLKRL